MRTLVVCLAFVIGVMSQGSDKNRCLTNTAQKSCADCIAAGPECAWCTSETFDQENKLRCDTYESHSKGNCDSKDIQFPVDSIVKLRDRDVQDGDRPEDAVQIQPQRVRVRVRPNKPMRIPIIFRQAENYPVDLYYLMDLSNSMEDDKENLAKLGNLIAEKMKTITKNFRLGFGSFVDKVVSPYVSTVPSKLKSPCRTVTGKKCEAPYGFKNQLRLDEETRKFAARVRKAPVSGNLDAPEGGFDAIMQAVVCEREIGWRLISRRMLVFSTDAGFHYAGDGKLGGIVTPNDGKCHMENGLYTESSNLDYPSVSQLSSKIKEKAVSVIFAVTEEKVPIYEPLGRLFDGITGELANDSSNIVRLIQDNYEKITSKVTLRAQHVGDNMTVEFYSRCFGPEEVKTNECEGLKIGQTVTFDLEINVNGCPANKEDRRREVVVKPVGFQEKLVLEINLLCQCDCELNYNKKLNNPRCNGTGELVCGQCDCPETRYGRFCECEADKETKKESTEKCIDPDSDSKTECSGQGTCECGSCVCFNRPESAKKFSGAYCQCDDYACPKYNGELCGGEMRGKCRCGACECNEGFNKTDCSCDNRLTSCYTNKEKGEVCSGHGKCLCGKCLCDEDYVGQKCEKCPLCGGDICRKYGKCVLCTIERETTPSHMCPEDCPLDIRKDTNVVEQSERELCRVKDAKDCWIYYNYEVDVNGEIILRVQEGQGVCPESLNVLAIVGGVIGGIVLVGLLLLLIWKLFAFIHDTREFAKFEAERQNAKWDTGENPIYKQATSTFKNPTYGTR